MSANKLQISKIIVGHAVRNNFKALQIRLGQDLNPSVIRDTQEHFKQRSSEPDFRRKYTLPELKDPSHEYSLRVLAAHLLHKDVQSHGVAHHNALDHARTTMSLYRLDALAFKTNAHMWDHSVDWNHKGVLEENSVLKFPAVTVTQYK